MKICDVEGCGQPALTYRVEVTPDERVPDRRKMWRRDLCTGHYGRLTQAIRIELQTEETGDV